MNEKLKASFDYNPLVVEEGEKAIIKDRVYFDRRKNCKKFEMKTEIGGYVYSFKLMPHAHTHELFITTEKYHLAILSLSEKNRAQLFLKLRDFLFNSRLALSDLDGYENMELFIKPYGGEESKEDVDNVIKLLCEKLPERAEEIKKYPINIDIFDMYEKTFGHLYPYAREGKDMQKIRLRYFMQNFRKYLPALEHKMILT